jgi:acyl-CoA reductase-like NAD-dependent aldehyde dehydrogenase
MHLLLSFASCSAASVEWFAAECRRVTGDVLETVDRGKRMITLKQPVGVVAAITPWNFPMSMITRKVGLTVM